MTVLKRFRTSRRKYIVETIMHCASIFRVLGIVSNITSPKELSEWVFAFFQNLCKGILSRAMCSFSIGRFRLVFSNQKYHQKIKMNCILLSTSCKPKAE